MPRIQLRISLVNKYGTKLARRPGERTFSEQNVQPGPQTFNKEDEPAAAPNEIEFQQPNQ